MIRLVLILLALPACATEPAPVPPPQCLYGTDSGVVYVDDCLEAL